LTGLDSLTPLVSVPSALLSFTMDSGITVVVCVPVNVTVIDFAVKSAGDFAVPASVVDTLTEAVPLPPSRRITILSAPLPSSAFEVLAIVNLGVTKKGRVPDVSCPAWSQPLSWSASSM
jgi:hypothetical protein